MSSKKYSNLFLLGREVRIFYNGRSFNGTVVDETRNTLILKTAGNEKTFPKLKSDIYIRSADGVEVKIEGSKLLGRPFERLLKTVRR